MINRGRGEGKERKKKVCKGYSHPKRLGVQRLATSEQDRRQQEKEEGRELTCSSVSCIAAQTQPYITDKGGKSHKQGQRCKREVKRERKRDENREK